MCESAPARGSLSFRKHRRSTIFGSREAPLGLSKNLASPLVGSLEKRSKSILFDDNHDTKGTYHMPLLSTIKVWKFVGSESQDNQRTQVFNLHKSTLV